MNRSDCCPSRGDVPHISLAVPASFASRGKCGIVTGIAFMLGVALGSVNARAADDARLEGGKPLTVDISGDGLVSVQVEPESAEKPTEKKDARSSVRSVAHLLGAAVRGGAATAAVSLANKDGVVHLVGPHPVEVVVQPAPVVAPAVVEVPVEVPAVVVVEDTKEAEMTATELAVVNTLSASENPAAVLDAMSDKLVQAAIAAGMNPSQAKHAGNSYTAALALKLSQGYPMSEAIARAEQTFKAETSFAPPDSPQEAATKDVAAGGNDVAAQITGLAHAQTSSGSAAFEQSLSAALAKGMAYGDAVALAQAAAQQSDQLTKTDQAPQSAIASGGATEHFANDSETARRAMGVLLAKGYTPEQAMRRAAQVADTEAAAARAEARNPASALASGKLLLPDNHVSGSSLSGALQSALARGVPMDEALARLSQIADEEQKAAALDANNPLAIFSSGVAVPEKNNAIFDRVLTNAIARGEAPGRALTSARRATESLPANRSSASGALASGESVESLLLGESRSRNYRMALGSALAHGMPVPQALALAKRAEEVNAFRYALPAEIARKLNGSFSVTVGGKPLPAWLQFNAAAREFVAYEVPAGALPLTVTFRSGKQELTVDVSEGAAPAKEALRAAL
jgi:hypothetical protein